MYHKYPELGDNKNRLSKFRVDLDLESVLGAATSIILRVAPKINMTVDD